MAVETLVKTGMVLVAGEMRTSAWVDVEGIAREVVGDIGYTRAKYGFDFETIAVISAIGKQSEEIANSVDEKNDHELGAGDQGMMFGYACRETEHFMPLPIALSHALTRQLERVRQENICPFLRPDGKSQVTVEYADDGKPLRVDAVVLSAQHDPDLSQEELHVALRKYVLSPVLESYVDAQTKYFLNPSGSFIVGGPQGDAGLTGRKIIVDTYGGSCPHGGGCFSGKDATKVDRTGAYAARHIAKNIVAHGLADRCQVQMAYAIGVAHPVSLLVDTFGTSELSNAALLKMIAQHWDLRPKALIERFNLQRPIFRPTATHGHFGNDRYPWEQIDEHLS